MITKILQFSVSNILIFFARKKLQGGSIMVPIGAIFKIQMYSRITSFIPYLYLLSALKAILAVLIS